MQSEKGAEETTRVLGNMDQPHLPFVMDNNKTYSKKGVDGVFITKQQGMVQHSFVKCGLSNKLDGSENSLVNIKVAPMEKS